MATLPWSISPLLDQTKPNDTYMEVLREKAYILSLLIWLHSQDQKKFCLMECWHICEHVQMKCKRKHFAGCPLPLSEIPLNKIWMSRRIFSTKRKMVLTLRLESSSPIFLPPAQRVFWRQTRRSRCTVGWSGLVSKIKWWENIFFSFHKDLPVVGVTEERATRMTWLQCPRKTPLTCQYPRTSWLGSKRTPFTSFPWSF